MKSLITSRRGLHPVYIAFMLVALMVGVAGGLQTPTLSLFLSQEMGVRPLGIGLFYTVNAIAGIITSLLLAERSDNRGDRRHLILFCCVMALCNTVLFAFNRNYLTLITLGVLLSALASVAVPQIFALAREYAELTSREIVMFSSVMRAQLSLAWVIGPPLSFALVLRYDFSVMYLFAAAMFIVSIGLIWFFLPSVPRNGQPEATAPARPGKWKNGNVRILFIASMLMSASNSMYLIDMPIYIRNIPGLSDKLAGVLMGMAAGLEIPVMLLAGYSVRRFGKRRMLLLAAFSGVLFFVGMVFSRSQSSLLAIQIFNALFIGIISGIGMLCFQDLMPGRAGAATTLFTNSISTGMILAGILQGALSDVWGHVAVYWVSLLLSLAAMGLLAKVRGV